MKKTALLLLCIPLGLFAADKPAKPSNASALALPAGAKQVESNVWSWTDDKGSPGPSGARRSVWRSLKASPKPLRFRKYATMRRPESPRLSRATPSGSSV